MQLRILWVVSVLLLISQLGYWLIDRGNTGKRMADFQQQITSVLEASKKDLVNFIS